MGFKRVWSTTGVVALTGALLLTSAQTASADYVRDKQWVLDVFAMKDTWSETQGQGVIVAVVDSGVDGSHPDLTGQVLGGKDFTGGGNAQEDKIGHGTKMASIIAGHGHGAGNSSGVIGLAPKAKILPLRTLQTRDDNNSDETWGAAVRYAVDHGAKVINLSIANDGGKTLSAGREAIAYAEDHDVVVVAGSGNDGSSRVSEPAALPGVLSVGAVDKHANVWEDSNSGKGLALTAPGVDIVGANPTMSNGYGVGSGTSDATAFVSAAAALVRAKYPDLTAGQIINRLIKSASFLGHKGLKAPDEEYGYGIIRPRQAVTMDIPAGPKENPLGQLKSSNSTSGKESEETGTSVQAEKKKSSSSDILVIAGGIAAAVVVVGVLFAVIRSRRNGGNGGRGFGGGVSPQGAGYPPQHPTYPPAQQPYPNSVPNQGYPTPPQHSNPYTQQPPNQGQ
ncbi:type VII secretion-associated serine protease mycosin [Streptomyces yaanensis]|uniref:Type VII secretion-associated serine protease mycosin n=1 Tax=Streptomyces yaanensis TaxID=1142239 RepID=A0ABV7SE46_9ACTN|nr:type VII secretion-associated serine protease mycosin [Streptomyces sp. CGMCC 4.7035]WNB98135.1 type VII secretion-associated serine protease mycosin [Streptomyces sp. CGMCC 4.7035]